MSFTAKDVMSLRQKTGLGMMDCKKALNETNGDPAAAEEWLQRNLKKARWTLALSEQQAKEKSVLQPMTTVQSLLKCVQKLTLLHENENFIEAVEKIADLATCNLLMEMSP